MSPNGVNSTVRANLNVETAANQIYRATEELQDAITCLANRLQPLLAPERPLPLNEDRAKGESELAECLLQQADYVRSRVFEIRGLIDRL